ncbi:MAG: ABC transporter ATP-binding protein [Deltaproteobacteria bacterium]|nr:ABC transporter ATP-binding protein [Deltaproteobacteria bacterium]MBW2413688.1 ABC transporter ATP-binding protein [Deltaproteobacteria bacterium]
MSRPVSDEGASLGARGRASEWGPDPTGSAPRDLLRMLGFARPYLWVIAIAIAFAWLYGGGLSARALLIRPLVDDVAIPHASLSSLDDLLDASERPDADAAARERELLQTRVRENFVRIAAAGVTLILLMPLLRIVRDYASAWVMNRLRIDLRSALGAKLLRLPLARHVGEARGEFITRISSDTRVANSANQAIFGELLEDSAVVLVALVLCIWISWQLSLSVLLIAPPVGLVLAHFGGRIRDSSKRRQEQVSEVMKQLVQILSGIKVIQAFGTQDREQRSFRTSLLRSFRRSMKVVRHRILSRAAIELITQASAVTVLLLGAWAILQGSWNLTLGKLMAFAAISTMLYRPVRGIASMWNTIQAAIPSARRLFEVLDAPEVTPDLPDARDLGQVTQGIRYESVSFRYEREQVLDGMDLEIHAGEVMALVGRSGAGKTTIADLLLRFHEPERGRILIDGIDLRNIRRASLNASTAVVTQDAFLFDDTIRANIAYGRPDAPMEDLVRVARAAYAHEFIEKLPQGYDTPVGELGGQLSGGQRQRLTIARALLRDPQILIFDEATSALDATSEQHVQKATRELMRGRTVLLIAHRLSTLKAADRIAVVDRRHIVATGTHAELMAQSGMYRDLVEAQMIGDR